MTYHNMKKLFKRTIKFKKKQYYQNEEIETINIAETDRSQFWNILKSKKSTVTPSQIHLSEWEAHFFHNPVSELLEINEYTNVGNHNYCFSS